MSNIIDAIFNLTQNAVLELAEYYHVRNRANNMGDAFEEYIKDLFANTFTCKNIERNRIHSQVFSYLGNSNNPPDCMMRNGDAIEVKKIESNTSSLALNSSYPKHTLKASNPMINAACRNAEQWDEKDIIYAVGVVDERKIKHLSMVYGLDYCASEECYLRIKNTIKHGVEAIQGIDFEETKELGHVNKVDPLGITYLRVRGMWGISNPWSVFNYVYERDLSKEFTFMCLINEQKWNTFTNTNLITELQIEGFAITDVEIRNPDNPAQLVRAKLITYDI